MDGKGWHLESRRHSEARLYGRASGSKQLKAPVPKGTLKVYDPKCVSKGNTLYYRLPNGKYVRWGSSWKIGAYKNVMKQFKELDKKDAEKKLSEVKKITPVKETPAQIEADYNAVSKPEYQTHKYDNKNILGIDNISTKDLIAGTKVKAESKAELELQLNEAFPNYEKSIAKVSDDIYNVKLTRQKEMQKEGEIKPDKNITPSDYAGFTGTEHYYKDYMGITLTDGMKDFQTRAEANWLTSDIAVIVKSHPKVRGQEFVTIKVKAKDETAVATYEDGNGNKLYSQNYKYTDLPKGDWKFFFRDNVLMFPSEY